MDSKPIGIWAVWIINAEFVAEYGADNSLIGLFGDEQERDKCIKKLESMGLKRDIDFSRDKITLNLPYYGDVKDAVDKKMFNW